uniref:Pentapeptide repeat-containing protein n=1 Tax=Haptolina ericina TaxID=156174 RepID=A0A7S3B1D2_9EUKA|mmetsp:Transcript_46710/g.105329  ORF Transcript_46710/g.105329 Transcript_46710/m.105329 type:complete len:217 (+) Transcript_46710:13-663(+)
MRLPSTLASNTQAAVAAALLGVSLTMTPPAFADLDYQGSKVGQDKQIASVIGKGAERPENSKIQGGGASTLQAGRRITITRGVNLDNTNWEGENLKGVAFQQSVVRSANFAGANLRTASFFDADLSNSNFKDASMGECNLEMADLTGADLTGADLTNAYMTGAVVNGPKGGLTKIDNTDWTDAQLRKDQRTYLCTIAKGENPMTGVETRMSLMCKD